MKQSMLHFFFMMTLLACNSSENAEKNEDLNKTFFPIAGTILAELKSIDSLPIAIIKYTISGEKRDTSIFSKQDMRVVADEMIKPDISLPEYKKYYKESVFMDNTVNTVTMSYTTAEEDPMVRKIEIMIDPDNQKVKTIYVEKLEHQGGHSILKKMIWTCGKNLQVISIVNGEKEAETVNTEKYEWGIN